MIEKKEDRENCRHKCAQAYRKMGVTGFSRRNWERAGMSELEELLEKARMSQERRRRAWRGELMRKGGMEVLVIKGLSMEWGKIEWEWAFAELNGSVRTA
jgi:hypothetical protein